MIARLSSVPLRKLPRGNPTLGENRRSLDRSPPPYRMSLTFVAMARSHLRACDHNFGCGTARECIFVLPRRSATDAAQRPTLSEFNDWHRKGTPPSYARYARTIVFYPRARVRAGAADYAKSSHRGWYPSLRKSSRKERKENKAGCAGPRITALAIIEELRLWFIRLKVNRREGKR